mmetsp:Transcript_5094/g.20330  ORF Transcript_5094/g.20330 Transcript_5094/m.20330 type:complete len:1383 (-) Transcript_5094:148-4296(-)
MSMSPREIRALMLYHLREGNFQLAQAEASSFMHKRGPDPALAFWSAVAKGYNGNVSGAIQDLESLRSRRDTDLAATCALRVFHRWAVRPDRDALDELDAQLLRVEENSSDAAKILTVEFYGFRALDIVEARRIARYILDAANDTVTPTQLFAGVALGWAELEALLSKGTRSISKKRRDDIKYFSDEALDRDLSALMGRAAFHILHGSSVGGGQRALDAYNTAIGLAPWFTPALVEQAKIFISTSDWDSAQDTLDRILSEKGQEMSALRLHALLCMLRGTDPSATRAILMDLLDCVRSVEGRNAKLITSTAVTLSRVANNNVDLQDLITPFFDLAKAAADRSDVNPYVAQAEQQLMLENFEAAADLFKEAESMKIDETDKRATYGRIWCIVLQGGSIKDAQQELELLSLIPADDDEEDGGAMVPFLSALTIWRNELGDRDEVLHERLLNEAFEKHMRKVQEHRKGDVYTFYRILNPAFLFQLAREFLTHAGDASTNPSGVASQVSEPVSKGLEVLQRLLSAAPAMIDVHLLLARTRLSLGQYGEAAAAAANANVFAPQNADAHLLRAQICLSKGDAHSAHAALQDALGANFAIQKSALYHVIRAQALRQKGDIEEALRTLEEALGISFHAATSDKAEEASTAGRAKRSALRRKNTKSKAMLKGGMQMTDTPKVVFSGDQAQQLSTKASLYVELGSVLIELRRLSDAQEVLSQAQMIFAGSPEEVRVMVANSELCIERGQFDEAVRLLTNVKPGSRSFRKAQMVKADIYLSHRHDRQAYAKCYKALVEFDDNVDNNVLLAEAYIRIQAPNLAIPAFQRALQLDPENATIACKIGRAYTSTHKYWDAVAYYEGALARSTNSVPLRHDLAFLHLRLKHFEAAIRVLEGHLDARDESPNSHDTLDGLRDQVKTLVMLSEVHEASGERMRQTDALDQALERQRHVYERVRAEDSHILRDESITLGDIFHRIGQQAESQKSLEEASKAYSDALAVCPTHESCLLSAATLHLKRGELDKSQQVCETLLRVGTSRTYLEGGICILADALFLKGEVTPALEHYQKILSDNPNNYRALAKLSELLPRYTGTLTEVERLIERAATADVRSASHAGLNYCRGVHARYANDPGHAVKHFNLARKDGVWGERALEAMIQVYLNPGNGNMWDGGSGNEAAGETNRIISQLLQEWRDMECDEIKGRILGSYALLLTRRTKDIDAAKQNFVDLLTDDRESVPALLGMSVAFMFEGQRPKARNTLKRIGKMQYQQDLASEFETAYLMLAELDIEKNKFDLAHGLCKRCLGFNKSSGRAWEILGLIFEKELSYADAADCYEHAWKLDHEASAEVGYKLAFNYLKARRWVEAIDVCRKVLKQYPDYPKIKAEILEKAQASLRP